MHIDNTEIAVVYKPAGFKFGRRGTITPLRVHAAELEHFGVDDIYASCTTERRQFSIANDASLVVNVFAIPVAKWQLLQRQVSGAFGFRDWQGQDYPELNLGADWQVSQPSRIAVEDMPVLIRELAGRKCRVYKQNDSLDRSRDPGRVNIEIGQDGRITGIWFG